MVGRIRTLRKVVAFVMCVVALVVSGVLNAHTPLYAATESEEYGFEIDETLFNVNWQETTKINVYQTVDTNYIAFKKGTYLGYAKVYTGFATSKKMVDGKYYQRILVQADMVPQTVSGKNKGMSQYFTIQVQNAEMMKNTAIEPASTYGSISYSTTGSLSLGGSLGYSDGVDGGGNVSPNTRAKARSTNANSLGSASTEIRIVWEQGK